MKQHLFPAETGSEKSKRDLIMKPLETNVMLFITIKMYRHITMLDFQGFIFRTLVTDVWRAGNQTFCQSWSWNGVVRKTDVNAFWHHLTDRSWVCWDIYTSVYVHAGKQIIISFQIWRKYVVRKWCLTWAIGLFHVCSQTWLIIIFL